MILYHGTSLKSATEIVKTGFSLSKGRVSTDFGQGFYTTNYKGYAIKTAKQRAKYDKSIPAIMQFNYVEKNNNLTILSFPKESVEWLQFIINNRNGIAYMKKAGVDLQNHNIDHKYDIVKGPIADHHIISFANEILEKYRQIDYNDVKRIKYEYKTMQISFHTIAALKELRFIQIMQVKRWW